MNSPAETPWYADGLAFQCTQCGQCCSGPASGYVWVDDQEISAMATQLEMSDDLEGFRRRFVRRVGTKESLVEYSDGDCIFLDPRERRCLVYAARPKQCRTWPFWSSNLVNEQAWNRTSQQCPGCNRGQVYSLEQIQRTQQIGTSAES
jgi:uncharacterized protein